MIWQDHYRAIPGGAVVAGVAVALKRHSDNGTIASTTTDAAGFFRFQLDGCPGPCYWEGTSDGKTRRKSSKALGPAGTVQLGELPAFLAALGDGVGTGVLDALVPTTPAGLTVRIGTGAAFVKGVTFANYVFDDMALGAAHATLPRIDTVVVEVARPGAADEGRAEPKVVAGTPAASPVAPALTQTAAVWQLPLADARVNAAATTIASLTDRRSYLLAGGSARQPAVTVIARRTNTSSLGVVFGVPTAVLDLNASLPLEDGVVYDVVVEVSLGLYVDYGGSAARIVSLAPFAGGTEQASAYIGHLLNQTWQTVANAHAVLGVVGSGAAAPFAVGCLVKASGGAAYFSTGVLVATAHPRS